MSKSSETRNFIALNDEERRTIAVLYGFRSLYATDIENYELYKKIEMSMKYQNIIYMR